MVHNDIVHNDMVHNDMVHNDMVHNDIVHIHYNMELWTDVHVIQTYTLQYTHIMTQVIVDRDRCLQQTRRQRQTER